MLGHLLRLWHLLWLERRLWLLLWLENLLLLLRDRLWLVERLLGLLLWRRPCLLSLLLHELGELLLLLGWEGLILLLCG